MMRIVLSAIIGIGAAAAGLAADPPSPESAHSAHTKGAVAKQLGREWEVDFPEEISLEEYARQLDYFKIEIAAVAKNGKIEYIAEVSQRKPTKRVGHRQSDYRLHIGWKSGTLHAADRRLFSRVGINSNGKELWHYFPIETQAQMERAERVYAGRDPAQLKRTRFAIEPISEGEGYRFVVVEQDPPRVESDRPAASANSASKSAHQPAR